jgi:hypothetical protein
MTTAIAQQSIQERNEFTPGQILTASWGYSMTLNTWYVVTRTTKASVWVQEICGAVSNDYGTGEGRAMPSMDCTPAREYDRDGQEIAAPVRRFKIQRYSEQETIWDSKKQRSIRIWDMKPKYHNTWD